MSRFSGKCDIYDVVEMIGRERGIDVLDYINNSEFYIYMNGRRHKVDIKTRKDLALYYPYIEVIGSHCEGKNYITFSMDSFIDLEEGEYISRCFKRVMKEYKKNKKKKVRFTADKYLSSISRPTSYEIEIAERVEKDGENANIDGIHNYMHEYYRKQWYDALVNLGWNEEDAFNWVYKELCSTKEEREERWKLMNLF